MRTSSGNILRCACIVACLWFFVAAAAAWGQAAGGILRGQVTDPSGAAVAGASVLLTTPTGASMDTTSNKDGVYEFKDLPAGTYGVKAVAQGFALFTKTGVVVAAGQVTHLNLALSLEEQKEKVEVQSTSTQVDVNPANNANTIVMQGKDLEALSDDPDELQTELEALAGPSAGPNGGQIYIDGFTAGQLPPKASIREIRINQNPFSSEYDKLGYGRVEIFTKPGTDKLHGQVMVSGNSSSFNSRNPFEVVQQGTAPPDYHTTFLNANIGGALNKKTSFFFTVDRRDIQNLGIVSATILDPSFNIVPYSAAVSNPETRTNLSPRIDYQLTPNNTLTGRYQYWRNSETNGEVGQLSLAAMGTNDLSVEHTLQLTDTQVIGTHVINESRFQYVHDNNEITPANTLTTINVGGAFTGNGSGMGGNSSDVQSRYEYQNTTYMNYGKHAWKFGARIRATHDVSANLNNYNGEFFFNSIQQYQQFELNTVGVTPTYYTQTGGKSAFDVNWVDAGLFVQDDWKVRPNITVSYGLRFETQNELSDKADFAPRIGIAWGIGGSAKTPPKFVLRAGFGIFYDRFTSNLILQQQRLGGVDPLDFQVNYLVPNPAFGPGVTPISPSNLPPATTPSVYVPNNNLRAPYTIQTGVTLERQLTKSANLAVTYLNSRGVHQFYTDNLDPYNPVTGLREPLGGVNLPPYASGANAFQYQSEGIFKQNQVIVNGNIRMGTRLSLFGYYTLNYANSDTSGAGTYASVPGDITMDYGRASFSIRHRLFMGGTIGLPYAFRFSPFLVASSGLPYNITTGTDAFQANVYNLRPELASCPAGTQTKYGCFSTPVTAQDFLNYNPIPINFLEGPGRFALNFRFSKTFAFGPSREGQGGGVGGPMGGGTFGRPGGGPHGPGGHGWDAGAADRRYSLTLSVNVRNAFNNVNLGTPVGNLKSPVFGESNSLAGGPFNSQSANRRLDLQLTFAF